VRGERRGHDPLVVRLVQLLVEHRVVQSAVDPVDEKVGEADENGELEKQVPATEVPRGALRQDVVNVGVATDLTQEPRDGKSRHDGHGFESLADLEAHLVLEELRVVYCCLVEDEDVRETSADKIVDQTKDPVKWLVYMKSLQAGSAQAIPCDKEQGDGLSGDVISRPLAHECI
jgi:hypothetical protein